MYENIKKLISNKFINATTTEFQDWYTTNPSGCQRFYLTPATFEKVQGLPEAEAKAITLKACTRRETARAKARVQYLDMLPTTTHLDIIMINVTWHRSNTWGWNPHAIVTTKRADQYFSFGGRASGCGYDKETAAVAAAANQSTQICAMLAIEWDQVIGEYLDNNANKIPTERECREIMQEKMGYGTCGLYAPQLEGGVGINCYYRIFENLGMKFAHTNSGEHSDAYMITQR